jgi:hypothetical protein
MKWFFFLLLAANLLFFGVMRWGSAPAGETMRGHDPFRAEQIRLLSEQEVERLRAEQPPAEQPPVPAGPEAPAASAVSNPGICLEWGSFSGAARGRALQALQALQLGDRLSEVAKEKAGGYWVYIPPRKSLQDALKKAEELKRLGIAESYVIQDSGKWRYAVSLGIFSTGEAAARYLKEVEAKGVRSALFGPRTVEGDAYTFRIRDADAGVAAQVARLRPDFPGTELKPVECK